MASQPNNYTRVLNQYLIRNRIKNPREGIAPSTGGLVDSKNTKIDRFPSPIMNPTEGVRPPGFQGVRPLRRPPRKF